MFQSRRVRLKPNKAQAEFFRKNFGAARFVYNWGLEQLNKYWEENKDKEKKDRTKCPTAFDLKKELTHLKNHCLAASISHASFGEIKRQLTYKCEWYGRSLQLVSRFYPSSQLCSHCGARNKEMKNLNKRTFTCPECGFTLDRDLNAAININNFCTHGEWETGDKANDRGDSSSTKKRYSLSSVANR